MPARLRVGACLSLSGRFGKFGSQAAAGLETLRELAGSFDLVIEDDRSGEFESIQRKLPDVATRCDLLLGPYSTVLMRRAGNLAVEHDWLIWNQGGSGDDVERAHPGNVVSILSPTSRYAVPFVRLLAAEDQADELVLAKGPGAFGRQVIEGAEAEAEALGLRVTHAGDGGVPEGDWSLLSAGVFEDDPQLVTDAMNMPKPPRRICAVAAGVREFARAIDDPAGIYGIAQWFPSMSGHPELGPGEDVFLGAYQGYAGSEPDYPAVQAVAGAVIALESARRADSTKAADLWEAARELETSTLFGGFRINESGVQVGRETALVRWVQGHLGQVV